MATTRTYKPKRHIVLDIETLSVKKNAVVVDLAAVCLDFNGRPTEEFHIYIRQGEQVQAGYLFHTDPETVDWHNRHDPEFLEVCENNGVSFQEAANLFVAWVAAQSDFVEVHYWSQGKDFDFPILENLMEIAGVKAPWAYSRIHCLRDLVWLNPAARISTTGPAPHKALLDAHHEAKQLIAVVQSSSWLQRLFK